MKRERGLLQRSPAMKVLRKNWERLIDHGSFDLPIPPDDELDSSPETLTARRSLSQSAPHSVQAKDRLA
jgi:hypothetical protein